MKYFTYKLWQGINSESEEVCDASYTEWRRNEEAYSSTFEIAKSRLSKKFLDIYLRNQGFHDYRLKSITIYSDERRKKSGPPNIT